MFFNVILCLSNVWLKNGILVQTTNLFNSNDMIRSRFFTCINVLCAIGIYGSFGRN
jgi:hypothetical protein